MASTITTTLSLTATIQRALASLDFRTPSETIATGSDRAAYQWASGTGDDEADLCYVAKVSIAASSDQDFDLVGSLINDFNEACDFARIKALIVINFNDQATLEVKPGPSNGWADFLTGTTPAAIVKPDGSLWAVAPKSAGFGAITGGSNDILRITNTHSSVAADVGVILIGASE
jgi:hypothetical protein